MTIRPVQSVASKFGFEAFRFSTAENFVMCRPLGRVRRRAPHRTLPIPPQAYRDGPDTERFRFARYTAPGPSPYRSQRLSAASPGLFVPGHRAAIMRSGNSTKEDSDDR